MNKYTLTRIMPFTLATAILFSGCGQKSECDIPTSHVHRYTKQFTEDIKIETYRDSEYLNYSGYNWHEDYIEINKVDEELFKLLGSKKLFEGTANWKYLYNEMATHHDYLMFYYEYYTTEYYTTTDSDGNTTTHTRIVRHDGWHNNPNDYDNTGKTRLYHHRYYGYRIVYENGKFQVEKSPAVDDIRQIISDYTYFTEDCITKVYETFNFKRSELPSLSPEDFDTFIGPDLENKSLESDNVRIRKP